MTKLLLKLLASMIFLVPLEAVHSSPSAVGALYFITNDPNGNSVVIHTVDKTGIVSFVNHIPTGGKGAAGVTDPPLGGDALFSQGSVQVVDDNLLVVNPGSNTLTMFAISPSNGSQLSMVGKPVESGGTFPMSIAVSPVNNIVCVLNGGSVTGVLCFRRSSSGLSTIPNSFKPLNDILNVSLSDPPTGSDNTLSHILFSSDGTKLHVSFKGINPSNSTAAKQGRILTFRVSSNGTLSTSSTDTPSPPGTVSPFGMSLIPSNPEAILNADSSFGFVVYNFSKTGQTVGRAFPVEGQVSNCWAKYSSKTKTFFLSDAGNGIITEVRVDSKTLNANIVASYPQNTPGTLDEDILNINGTDYLYVLNAGSASINVLKLSPAGKASNFQTVSFENVKDENGNPLTNNAFIQGMAAWSLK